MPYYSLRVKGGDYEDCQEIKALFNGRDADFTGNPTFFYVQRDYDIETMKRNSAGGGKRGVTVDVNEITEREYNWRKYR